MLMSFRMSAFGLAALFGLISAAPAQAGHTVPVKASSSGQVLFQIDPTPDQPVGVQVYDAVGHSTVLGHYLQRGITFFTPDGNVSGVFVLTASDGSTVSGSYTGTFAPIPGTPDFEFQTESVFENGTGRLAGATGGASNVAVLDGMTGTFELEVNGFVTFP